MKTIGLLGGMSWESTLVYYREINEAVREALGGLHSAKCVLYSVDFDEIEACQAEGRWDDSAAILANAAEGLRRAGAELLVICTNTMHRVADTVEKRAGIPLLHIADLTADALLARGIARVGMLGTRYTMEQDFYKARLQARGIDVLIPDEADRAFVNDTIYRELCVGIVSEASGRRFLAIVDGLARAGAGGVILGCTEIGLLIGQGDTRVPLFDTTRIHARRAAEYAMKS